MSARNPKAAAFFGSILTTFLPVDAGGQTLLAITLYCIALSALLHSITAIICYCTAIQKIVVKNDMFQKLIALTYGLLAAWGLSADMNNQR